MHEKRPDPWQWPRELWQKFLTVTPLGLLRRAESLKGAPKEVQFSLSHVFIRELIEQFEAFSRLETLDASLTALSKHQIEVFVREELGMPLHPGYFMELSRSHWQKGEIFLRDSYYLNQESMLERSRRGVAAASSPEQKERYEMETHQIERLQEELSQEILSGSWVQIPNGPLKEQVQQRYSQHQGKIFALGQKMLTTMSKSRVHAGDKSYVNVMQALYLPAPEEQGLDASVLQKKVTQGNYLGRIVTVSDSLFYDLTNQDLVDTHALYSPLPLQPEESILMQVVTRLPSELSAVWGRQVFIDMASKLLAQEQASGLTHLLGRQQASEQKMRPVLGMIEDGSRFLAQVLLLELARATVNDPEFLDFPTRLYYAFGLVASPLLQRLEQPNNASIFFSYDLARENYQKTHTMPPLPALQPGLRIDPKLRETVVRPEFLRQVKKVQMTAEKKELYRRSLGDLPGFYLNQVVSNSLCNAFSFGSFGEASSVLQTPFVQNVLSGAPVHSLAEVQSVLGAGSEGWHKGVCQHPDCPNAGVQQMVGLCDICLHCQLQSELGSLPDAADDSLLAQDDRFAKQLLGSYATLAGVADDARKFSLSASLLPLYMLQENVVSSLAHRKNAYSR